MLVSENGVVPTIGQELVDVVVDPAELAGRTRWLLDELRDTHIPFFARWFNSLKHLRLSQMSEKCPGDTGREQRSVTHT